MVVWRLDRLGRTLRHLIELITELEGRGIGFRSITEAIDTTSPGGTLVFHIFGALAEFERNLTRERTMAGLEAARARGRRGGRRHKLDARKRALAVELYRGKRHTVVEICDMVGISKPTLYAYVRAARDLDYESARLNVIVGFNQRYKLTRLTLIQRGGDDLYQVDRQLLNRCHDGDSPIGLIAAP